MRWRLLTLLLILLSGCSTRSSEIRQSLSLAGQWQFSIDSLDKGVSEEWFNKNLIETVNLPGSVAENSKGNEVTANTDWTGEIVDKSYYTDPKYAKYRVKGNIKIPFWLKPAKYYKGPAWYQKDFDLPVSWDGKKILLFLERPHWETTVFVNGRNAGTNNSLSVAHNYDITKYLIKGRNRISVRVDNRMIIPVGINSHSVTDHTQSNWNGIAGDIRLDAISPVSIRSIKITPDVAGKKCRVEVAIENAAGNPFRGKLNAVAELTDIRNHKYLKKIEAAAESPSRVFSVFIDYPIGEDIKLWDEFLPALYRMSVTLEDAGGKTIDAISSDFGMRDFKTKDTRFSVNGRSIFLRGTLECCIFPKTGYPPTDTASWMRVLKIFRSYGLNTVRFHSWCPPEAAFEAADRLGFYLQIECASWANSGTSIGDGLPVDRFIYEEGDRILEAYGNHPSFCMLAYGNEPAGKNQNEYLGKLLNYWKAKDNRRIYTSGAGWPIIPENDYNLTAEPRIQRWGEGLKSILNGEAPQTKFDFSSIINKYSIPVVGHEIGQWCAYPDFSEIPEYTGVLKPTNFEIFKESLTENHLADKASLFLKASGKLQALCYKADVEAALRTKGFAGFHLLQLHDFPGQGTALVGVLNAFFRSKGYISPEEFRMFCSPTVPLARLDRMLFRNSESFIASVEVAHFGPHPIDKAELICQVVNTRKEILHKEIFTKERIETGSNTEIGIFEMDLSGIKEPQQLIFQIQLAGTQYSNQWNFWVYPESQLIEKGKVLVTDKLDNNAKNTLKGGGSVLLLNYGRIGKKHGADVAIGFSTVFWNTAWTNNQAPHTLGILCDPVHPLFRNFPTSYHSDYQWWDPVTHSQAMIIDYLPEKLQPLIQPIDTWFSNRRLALAFEARCEGGKLIVCSIDLANPEAGRLSSRQLVVSMLNYMNSVDFKPVTEVSAADISKLTDNN